MENLPSDHKKVRMVERTVFVDDSEADKEGIVDWESLVVKSEVYLS